MSELLRQLNERPIAYHKIYRRVTGSTTAGLLLSQLMYWFSKQDVFYKTNADIIEETELTPDELKSAKRRIKSLDFITIEIRGVPAKTFYSIDWDLYEGTLLRFAQESSETSVNTPPTSQGESPHPVGGNPTNCAVEIPPTINDISFDIDYTETTTDIISRKSARKKNKTSFPSDDRELKEYAIIKASSSAVRCPIKTYESFKDHHLANGPTFKDWQRAFNMWVGNFFKFETPNSVEVVRLGTKTVYEGTYDYDQQLLSIDGGARAVRVPLDIFFTELHDGKVKVIGKVS